MPLTDREIKNVKFGDKDFTLCDGGGLQLLVVAKSKSRLWQSRYRYKGKRYVKSHGAYPAMSLAGARERNVEISKLIANDINPKVYFAENDENHKANTVNTFEKIATQWINHRIRSKIASLSHNEYILGCLKKYLFTGLGEVPIKDLTVLVLIEELRAVEKRSLDLVGRMCGNINSLMRYAVYNGYISDVIYLKANEIFSKAESKNQPYLDYSELSDFMHKMQDVNMYTVTRYLMKFQIHTMVRCGEAAVARWSEIDFDTKIWTVPHSRMKSEKTKSESERRDHLVPLTSQVIQILQKLKELNREESVFIFPSPNDCHQPVSKESLGALLRRNGYKGVATMHGMRTTASTYLNDKGCDYNLIEKALSHTIGTRVSQVYNKATYVDLRRDVMQLWSDFVTECQNHQIEN